MAFPITGIPVKPVYWDNYDRIFGRPICPNCEDNRKTKIDNERRYGGPRTGICRKCGYEWPLEDEADG